MPPASKDGPTRYIEAHKNAQGPGDARPTALQITQDNDLVGKVTDKTFLITARSPEKAEKVKEEILADEIDVTNPRLDWNKIENASLQSVKEGAKNFLERSDRLNILIGNAGIAHTPRAITEDGFEQQFAVNHLAHFLLFELLKPLMLDSSKPDFHSRYVAVSSAAHMMSGVQIGNYSFQTKVTQNVNQICDFIEDTYSPMIAYGQAKTANIWMANEIEQRNRGKGLYGLSIHPGTIFTAGYANIDERAVKALGPLFEMEEFKMTMKNVEQGASTQVMAAVDKELEGKGGLYLNDCFVNDPLPEGQQIGNQGYQPYASDPEGEKKLWHDSFKMVGLHDSK